MFRLLSVAVLAVKSTPMLPKENVDAVFPAAAPDQELEPEGGLELVDLRAQGLRRQAQLAGRRGHAAAPRDRPEVLQVVVVQPARHVAPYLEILEVSPPLFLVVEDWPARYLGACPPRSPTLAPASAP